MRSLHKKLAGIAVPLLAASLAGQSSIRGWGPDGYFDTDSRSMPAVFASAYLYQTVVVRADGRLFVQGSNWAHNCEAPPAPPGLHYLDAHIGNGFGIGRLSDGSLVLWGGGSNAFYAPPLAIPALPLGTSYVQYAVGADHAMFLRSDGAVLAIGKNVYGQCNVPAFPPGVTIVELHANSGYSAALLSDGSLVMWGANDYGQCNVPPLPAGLTYTAVSLGGRHTLAIRSDGSMVAFGWSVAGLNTVPPLPNGVTWVRCVGGTYHSIGVRSDGLLEAWGDNTWGQLDVPVLPAVPIADLDAGAGHTVVRLADGRVYAWGLNSRMQCDLPTLPGPSGSQPSPRYADLAAGGSHCLAIRSDGMVTAFGNDDSGQLDLPPTYPWLSYVKVMAGKHHSAALRSDGQLVMFGYCGIWCNVPTLPLGVTYVDAALSTIHTVALRSDGQAVAFGDNSSGISTIPPLPAGLVYMAVDAHYFRTLLLRSDDALFSLGDFGHPTPYPTPAPPPAGVHYAAIACSRDHDAALRTDGTAVLWGSTGGVGWVNPPPLPWGRYYVEIDGGEQWSALRRSDGEVVPAGTGAALWNAPPLDPGTSYLQLSGCYGLLTARVGPTSTYVGIGHGCAGSMGSARLVPADTPRIGKTFALTCFDLPADLALLAMSFAVPPAPLPLASVGMPGCDWHIGLDGTALLVGANGSAGFALAIPDVPALVGATFQHQALVLDPAVGNAFGAVVSDAMQGVIGVP